MIAGQTSTPERGRVTSTGIWRLGGSPKSQDAVHRVGLGPPVSGQPRNCVAGLTRASAAPVLSQIKFAYLTWLKVSRALPKFGQGEGGAT